MFSSNSLTSNYKANPSSFVNNKYPILPPILYINLDRSVKRRQKFEKNIEKIGLQVERFPGIDGKKYKLSLQEEKIFRNVSLGRNRKGEIGCALSHYYLWKKMLERGEKLWIVAEDDMTILPSIKSLNFSELPENHICFLYHTRKFKHSDPAFNKMIPKRWSGSGTCLYSITNKAARLLCNHIEKEGLKIAVDWFMINYSHVPKFLSSQIHTLPHKDGDVYSTIIN